MTGHPGPQREGSTLLLRASRQIRERYARTNGDLLVNSPDGLPSGMEPVVWWWGSDLTGTPVTERQALAAVTRATSLIVNTPTSLPWLVMSGDPLPAGLSRVQPTPRWVADPMLLRPDARGLPSPQAAALRLSRGVFWAQWMRSALWRGMGYLMFAEGAAGQPAAGTLRILNPASVTPLYDDPALGVRRRIGSQLRYDGFVDTDLDGRFVLGGTEYRLVELRNPTADADEYGITPGVLTAHAGELEQAQAQVAYGRGTLRSGVPAGYLKVTGGPPLTQPKAEELKRSWLNAHGGDRRSIAVLNATTEFEPIALSPVDMALIEMRKMSLLDIANAFGVPVYMLGGTDGGSNTYSNAESRNRDFLTFSLMPWASTVEDVLSSLLPAGSWLEVDFNGLLKSDLETRYSANTAATGKPWKTVDEVRAEENLPPMPAPPPDPVPDHPEEVGAE